MPTAVGLIIIICDGATVAAAAGCHGPAPAPGTGGDIITMPD